MQLATQIGRHCYGSDGMFQFPRGPIHVFLRSCRCTAIFFCAIALLAKPCPAQVWKLTKDGFTVSVGVKAGVGGIATGNTNFGAGFVESDGTVSHDVGYAEGYV